MIYTKLKVLDCYGNKLTQLDNLPQSLKKLYCQNNNITQLRLYIDDLLVKTISGGINEEAGYINFSSLDTTNRIIPSGRAVTLEVKADFASNFSTSGDIYLAITNSNADIVVQNGLSSDTMQEIVLNINTACRKITLDN